VGADGAAEVDYRDPRRPPGDGAFEVPVGRIQGNPSQPRQRFDTQELDELTDSIREHGILQPLLVSELPKRDDDGGVVYQLIAGERRLRAAMAAGLDRVPVTLRRSTPQELLELAIIENVQRSDLNPLEEAMAYQRLAEQFALSHREIGERVGRSRATIANTMRLVELPEEVRESLVRGEVSEGHARALLSLEGDEARLRAWRRVVDERLNVRQTERLVKGWNRPEAPSRPRVPRIDAQVEALAEQLRRSLGTKVTVRRSRLGSGSVTLHFFSDEEFEGILSRLLGEERAV
jgi:ParB family chromosome partitioning protein